MSQNNSRIEKYMEIIAQAGRLHTADELIKHVENSVDIIEEGMLSAFEILKRGNMKDFQEVFCMLDASKSLVAKNLIHRRDIDRSGSQQPDLIISLPNPGGVASFLKSRGHDTAIVSFHVCGKNKVGVFIARGGDSSIEVHSIPGFGDVYYDGVYIDGVKPNFLTAVENYASSLISGQPCFDHLRSEFEFISTVVFMLLFKPRPPKEVIFLPHKLYGVLPLHAMSTTLNGRKIYLHDVVEVISYSSCLQELIYAGKMQIYAGPSTKGFLRVSDIQSGLDWLEFEKAMLDVTEESLNQIGVRYDVAEEPKSLPLNYDDYIWINWSSHSKSHPTSWGDSFLVLGEQKYTAKKIATEWNCRLHPVAILAACESCIDISSGFAIDESFGLDLAFRAAGARASIASLWKVDDPIAALTAVILPAWHFQFGLAPDIGLTALQRHFQTGTWKSLLLRDEQLLALPAKERELVAEIQEELWNYPDEAYEDEASWASFRCHGR